MEIDIEAEVQKLREHCEKPRPEFPDVEKARQVTLDFIEDDTKGQYRMFSATLDYFATGEGRTTAFVANGAHSKREFLNYLIEKMRGYWFVIGMSLYEGMPVDDDIYDHLFSKNMKKDQRQLAYFECYLEQHYNFS